MAENKKLEAAKQLASDYKFVFGSKEGQRVLENIIAECHVLEPNNSVETNIVMIQEGRRDAALNILKHLTWDERQLISTVGGDA